MNTMFMNSKNSKISDTHRLLLNLTDKIKLRRSDRYVALSNLSIYYTWKNIKKLYKNNRFKILAPTWNEESELPNRSYSLSVIQDYFEYIWKTMGKKLAGYYLEYLMLETMKLFESTKSMLTKDKNDENMPHLEITEVVLVHCNIVNNDYQQNFNKINPLDNY